MPAALGQLVLQKQKSVGAMEPIPRGLVASSSPLMYYHSPFGHKQSGGSSSLNIIFEIRVVRDCCWHGTTAGQAGHDVPIAQLNRPKFDWGGQCRHFGGGGSSSVSKQPIFDGGKYDV